jgi:cyclohexyl-isocyanide hydratase
MAENPSLAVGLLLFPNLTQLDLTGPYEVFARTPGCTVHVVWKTTAPVKSDRGLALVPTTTFADCPQLDILCVPGGPGQVALMEDAEVLGFLRQQAAAARYVTSVCTGSLVLGAAGLLKGYRATTHWMSHDQLSLLGAIPVDERIVIDRNRITGGGVTAGIDFALAVVGKILGPEAAQAIQLQIEYNPAPPFDAGHPRTAPVALVEKTRAGARPFQEKRRAVTENAAKALGI